MLTRNTLAALLVAGAVCAPAVAGAADPENPWKLDDPEFADVGVYKHIAKPKHREPDEKDHPLVRRIHPLWQEDQKYASMFSPKGASEICGPTSATMVFLFLKEQRKPNYPKIFKDLKDHEQAVHHMFELMSTSRSGGTSVTDVNEGMWSELERSGYKVSRENSFIIGEHAGLKENQISPTMEILSKTHNHNDTAILLFGWYHVTKTADHKWQVKRTGGHYVVLAGVDREKKNTFYVTNPLTDYKDPEKRWFSKVELEKIDVTSKSLQQDEKHELRPHMLFTRDLVGGHAAILEEIIVVAPE